MESLQFPHVLIYLRTSPLQKLNGRRSRAVIPGEGTRIVTLRIIFWEFSIIFFHIKIAIDYPNELFMVLSWGRMLCLFTQSHVDSMSVSASMLAHMCLSHVHALKVALRHPPPAFFSPPALCLVSIAGIGSGLGKREPSHFQLLA